MKKEYKFSLGGGLAKKSAMRRRRINPYPRKLGGLGSNLPGKKVLLEQSKIGDFSILDEDALGRIMSAIFVTKEHAPKIPLIDDDVYDEFRFLLSQFIDGAVSSSMATIANNEILQRLRCKAQKTVLFSNWLETFDHWIDFEFDPKLHLSEDANEAIQALKKQVALAINNHEGINSTYRRNLKTAFGQFLKLQQILHSGSNIRGAPSAQTLNRHNFGLWNWHFLRWVNGAIDEIEKFEDELRGKKVMGYQITLYRQLAGFQHIVRKLPRSNKSDSNQRFALTDCSYQEELLEAYGPLHRMVIATHREAQEFLRMAYLFSEAERPELLYRWRLNQPTDFKQRLVSWGIKSGGACYSDPIKHQLSETTCAIFQK